MTHAGIEASRPMVGELESFLAEWRYLPYRRSWRGDRAALAALETHRVRQIIETAGAHTWTAGGSARLTGFVVLRPLPWDSAVLRVPAARLFLLASGPYEVARAIATALLETAMAAAASQGIQHVSVRVDAGNDPAVHALEAAGFLNVDTLLTFSASPEQLSARDRGDAEFDTATPADAASVADLAADTFTDGRFHADPSIPRPRARDIYRQWAANCCRGIAADHTIVASIDGRRVGFVGGRVDHDTAVFLAGPTGTIPLIAVHESARGRGVGSALIAHAQAWFIEAGVAMVEVGTQARNVAAARLYQRCGFQLSDSSQTFHLMINP